MARWIVSLLVIALLLFGALRLWRYVEAHPEDVPWTALDLADPVGAFTARKLAALTSEPAQCLAILEAADDRFTPLPARSDGPQCGYGNAVRYPDAGAPAYRPRGLGVSCPVAAALLVWEREVVQPAARRRFGSAVASIDHFGSYSCRRISGRSEGSWSEHARANALDIAGFRLADGRRVTVAGDWHEPAAEAAFLHDVRDGACRLFATVLSPDYNAAHRDHLHFDQATRGSGGWRMCR